jgi:hypothetical protein
MIQNLPPSVVLNTKKTKLAQGGKNGAAAAKAGSTYVSPSASSTSFIVGNNQHANGGHQAKMSYASQIGRDSKGSDKANYPKANVPGAFPGVTHAG